MTNRISSDIAILIGLILVTFIIGVNLTFSITAQAQDDNLIPERNGTYNVPGHPELKVRVFVHHPKQTRKTKTVPPILICDAPDPDSNANVSPAGWYLPESWAYNLNMNSAPQTVGALGFQTIVSDSFSVWQTASNGKVNFTRGADTEVFRPRFDGENIITWGRTSASALAVTYTWFNNSSGLVAEVDTIINNKYLWSWSGNNGGCADINSYDAQDIVTHELGHWMGLDDEYTGNFVDNTMYGYGSKGEIKKDTLATGDILAASLIYN